MELELYPIFSPVKAMLSAVLFPSYPELPYIGIRQHTPIDVQSNTDVDRLYRETSVSHVFGRDALDPTLIH